MCVKFDDRYRDEIKHTEMVEEKTKVVLEIANGLNDPLPTSYFTYQLELGISRSHPSGDMLSFMVENTMPEMVSGTLPSAT